VPSDGSAVKHFISVTLNPTVVRQ